MVTSHFLSGRHTHTQPWPVCHQREKPSYIIVVQAIDLQIDVVDLSESGSHWCCLLQFSFGLVFFSHYKHSRLLFFEGWSFRQCFVTSITMQKGPKGPKCSRELRSNWEGALPRPFHDLLCHLAKGLNFNFALSRQISVSEVPTTLRCLGGSICEVVIGLWNLGSPYFQVACFSYLKHTSAFEDSRDMCLNGLATVHDGETSSPNPQ